MASDYITTSYLQNESPALLAAFRFAPGFFLLPYCDLSTCTKIKYQFFAIANISNQSAGILALTKGTLAAFAAAGQLRPALVVIAGVLLFGYSVKKKDMILFIIIMLFSCIIFHDSNGLYSLASLIYSATVGFQAISLAMIGKTGEKFLPFLGYYNIVGFFISLIVVIFTDQAVDSTHNMKLMMFCGIMAFLGGIMNFYALSSQYKVLANAVPYVRLPLTIVVSFFVLHEDITWVSFFCSLSVFILLLILTLNKK